MLGVQTCVQERVAQVGMRVLLRSEEDGASPRLVTASIAEVSASGRAVRVVLESDRDPSDEPVWVDLYAFAVADLLPPLMASVTVPTEKGMAASE